MQYPIHKTILTFALIVDTRFVTRARVITAASNVTHAIMTYLIYKAVIITVTYCFTNAAIAPFVAQAICITKKILLFNIKTS